MSFPYSYPYCHPQACYYCYYPAVPMAQPPPPKPKNPSLVRAREELTNSMFESLNDCKSFLAETVEATRTSSELGRHYTQLTGGQNCAIFDNAYSFIDSMKIPDFGHMINPIDDTDCWTNIEQDLEREAGPASHMTPRDPKPKRYCWYDPPPSASSRPSTTSSQGSTETGTGSQPSGSIVWKYPRTNPNVPTAQSYPSTNAPQQGSRGSVTGSTGQARSDKTLNLDLDIDDVSSSSECTSAESEESCDEDDDDDDDEVCEDED